MRRLRPLFLIAIVAIGAYLAHVYRQQIEAQRRQAPPPPRALPQQVNATASDWHWEKSSGQGPMVSVRAKNFRQIKEPNHFELEQIELKIYRRDGRTYDRVTSDRAVFDLAEAYLYAEGEANITMGVPDGEEPKPGRLIHIQSTGVRFDSKTGKAETEREATFAFDRGEGRALGAKYDPAAKELHLRSQVQLIWKDQGKNSRPMKVEAGEAIYKESESKVFLSPWAKLSRGNTHVDGNGAVVTLDEHGIRLVETTGAKGTDQYPGRSLEYSADQLTLSLSEKSEIEKIKGHKHARLTAVSEHGMTSAGADAVELEFEASGGESVLKRALASGTTVVESRPSARPGRLQPETRILRSEVVEIRMREGGHEVQTIDTHAPGVLEFLPNRPGQRRRRVDGDRFHLAYGPENQLESFHAIRASTRTENEPRQGKPSPPSLTSSQELMAWFSAKTAEMARLEQWGDFRYEEGDRKARGQRAILENEVRRMTLVNGARVWDAQGATSADRIVMDQKTEDFVAEGSVTSSRLPDRKGSGTAMLSNDEPLQAKAARMSSFDRQSRILYEGNAVLWQGGSRLEAGRIEIDRKNSTLKAGGKVLSQLLDQQKEKQPKAKAAPVFTLIQAPSMVYSDKDRVAHYTGGVSLRRAEMDVKAQEIKAYLKEQNKEKQSDGESSLDHATAHGGVVILETAQGRVRRGVSGYAEYYVNEQKVVLEQGDPVFEDSLKGTTRGQRLIYYANEDRLLVNGVPAQPAMSKIRRK